MTLQDLPCLVLASSGKPGWVPDDILKEFDRATDRDEAALVFSASCIRATLRSTSQPDSLDPAKQRTGADFRRPRSG